MIANLCTIACALWIPQAAENATWLLAPRFDRGQELFYRGTYTEDSLGKGVQFHRAYRLENRLFILESTPKGYEAAVLTLLKQRQATSTKSEEIEPSSIKLETAKIDLHGKLALDGGLPGSIPLDGPAISEWGAVVSLPRHSVGVKQTWEVSEANRPGLVWRVIGTETASQTSCVKIEGVQQSDDWEQPRADRAAWRRRETVWLAPKIGVVYRLERVIERRDAAHNKPTYRAVTLMDLQSNITYPGQLYEDRRRDILQTKRFFDTAAPLLPDPSKQPARAFDTLLTKIQHHLDNQPPTPYREAVLQVKKRVETAKRGESPPIPFREEVSEPPAVASLDQRAPDFLVTNLLTGKTAKLSDYAERPLILVFISPKSRSVEEVLGFAEQIQAAHPRHAQILTFAIGEDVGLAKKLHAEHKLKSPLLSGNGLRQSYGVEATPRFVIVDAEGILRASYIGWGPETSSAISAELKRWIRPPGLSTSSTKSAQSSRP